MFLYVIGVEMTGLTQFSFCFKFYLRAVSRYEEVALIVINYWICYVLNQ